MQRSPPPLCHLPSLDLAGSTHMSLNTFTGIGFAKVVLENFLRWMNLGAQIIEEDNSMVHTRCHIVNAMYIYSITV